MIKVFQVTGNRHADKILTAVNKQQQNMLLLLSFQKLCITLSMAGAMDTSMDDLMDLLSYSCPVTGQKRTAGCENGQLYMKYLGHSPFDLG